MAVDISRILEESRAHSFDLFEEHVSPQWSRVLRTIGFNRNYVRGENAWLFDSEGRRYLDFMSGWGVFNFGRGYAPIRDAVAAALESEHPGWVAFDAPVLASKLSAELKRRVPNELDFTYFCNSGTEAIEAAIKLARGATGRAGVVHLVKSFHGLTNGSLAVNGDSSFRGPFEHFLDHGTAVKMGDLEALEQALATGEQAAFIFEPVQGKGVFIPPEGYLLEAQRLCRKYGTLMIADEVQSGLGRTGKFCAIEWEEGLDPDFILFSKALSGGFVPVGAVVMRRGIYEKVYSSMERAMIHACTFGMGNLAMAAGLAVVDALDESVLARTRELGTRFREGIEALKPRYEMISEVRQRGLMIGIEFGAPRSLKLKTGWTLVHKMDENLFPQAVVIPLFDDHRILTQVAGHAIDVVKLLPPLTITDEDVTWFLEGFEDCMSKLHRFPGPVWEVLKKLGKHAVTARSREKAEQSV